MRKTILIVDDSATNRALIEEILAEDYDLLSCASGEAALELMESRTPDLVLLDLMMPGIDGLETCREIRSRSALRHTMVILLSAQTATSERLAGYEAGADDYVVKPFDPEELRAKIRVFMRLKVAEEIGEIQTDLITAMQRGMHDPVAKSLARTSEQAAREGQRLRDIALRGLTFCRLRAGQEEVKRETLDLARVVVRAASGIDDLFVVCNVPKEGGVTSADVSLMKLAVESLVAGILRVASHARRAHLEVSLERTEADIVLSVVLAGAVYEGGEPGQLLESAASRTVAQNLDLPLAQEVFRVHGGRLQASLTAAEELRIEATLPVVKVPSSAEA